MAVLDVKTDATEVLIAGYPIPDGATWAQDERRKALAVLREQGAPDRRDEYWKFTRPDTLVSMPAPKAAVLTELEAEIFDAVDRLRIVFVDGVYDAAASDDLSGENVSIETLDTVMNTDIHWAKGLYGVLENAGQDPVARPLAALNTAVAQQGIVVHATGKVAKPINMIYIHEDDRSDAMIHHLFKLDAGADVTILENGPVAARSNIVMEVDVADGAAFHHVRAQGRDHERRAATHMFGRLGTESSFKSFTLTMNGVLTRNEAVLEFTGDNAHGTVAGACVGDGDFHHDDTVFITHDGVHCESRQVFKKVLRNGATGAFQGKILVKADAQKTDGYQISQALLLDEDSNFLAKPELEIYADDVVCSHGSTCGAVDETALFYLTSRGIPKGEAEDLLTLSFLAEAIEEIEDEVLAEAILDRLKGWMTRRRG